MPIRQDIEFLRVISAFGIVWFHAGAPGRDFAYSGLVIFLVLSIFLSSKSGEERSTQFKKRAKRFLVPWIIWFIFYGVIRYLTQKPIIPLNGGLIAGVLSGSSSHLWYLPYMFFILVILDNAKRALDASTLAWLGYALTLAAVLSWGPWNVPLDPALYPWTQWAHATAGVSTGVLILHYRAIPEKVARYLIVSILLACGWNISISGFGIPYMIGIGVTAFVLLTRSREIGFDIQPISKCTLGVYLLHPFGLIVLKKSGFGVPVFNALIAFSGSILIIWWIRRWFPRAAHYLS